MNRNQAAAYVVAQSVAALAEIEAMKAQNRYRIECGKQVAYGEEAFLELIDKYGVHHNAVLMTFEGADD